MNLPVWNLPIARWVRIVMLSVVTLVPPSAHAGGAAELPASAFFQHAALSAASLSPSGTLVALRVGAKDARDRLAVLDLQTMKVQQVASFDDADVITFRWVNDKRLVFTVGDRRLALADRSFAPGLFAVNADGSGYKQLVQRERVMVRDNIGTSQLPWNTFLLTSLTPQLTDEVYVVQPEAYSAKGADFHKLLRLNTVTGRAVEIDTPLNAFDWLFDRQGQLRAVLTAKLGRAAIHWRDADTGAWRQLREFDRFLGDELHLGFIAPDGTVYASSQHERDTLAVYTYDPAKDTLSAKPLLETPQFDVEPQFIGDDRHLLGVRFTVDATVTQWFDEGMKAQQARVDKLLPATANLLTPPQRGDSPWVLVEAFADIQPRQYLLLNKGTGRLTRLGGQRPDIEPGLMSPMDLVRYKARDGLEIPAFLTLPRSAAVKQKLPLIVYVHGGPWVRGGEWEWQPDVQFLASRGYAVLQPEFRGSRGFGRKHLEAGFKQWGLAMQDDLADGARWAIAQGIADPRRIGIMGASYGGYATLMGLIKDGDLFRCGVEWVGVTDLLLLYDASWSDLSDDSKRYALPVVLGDRTKDAALLEANSPVMQHERLKNPLLMGHGRIDQRVPIEHGERLYKALRSHNTGIEWVQYDKDGHGWSLPETEVDWWTRIEKFLTRHIGTAAPP